ncbi:hypothetical protein A4X06_0g3177 [Tilletia controversa]|uniref:Uncharacterized protein n=2 Tax=Tilletia TaxID=13289 RepID=A0A8X7MUX8_9BASI|nr:hypothetical protein CF328_g5077 [Tilletia controversa]KAE8201420.1 hypothetical protein CF336_g209 [Tilletia laevis]KAE8207911.1 hypothetical protein CF335_g799 [Tilletia laevis]KAE8249545.1 hypothetical protein A4X06_0g3177 [Tilletia controversa]
MPAEDIDILAEIGEISQQNLNQLISEPYRAGLHELTQLPPFLEGEARRPLVGLSLSEGGVDRVLGELRRLGVEIPHQAQN